MDSSSKLVDIFHEGQRFADLGRQVTQLLQIIIDESTTNESKVSLMENDVNKLMEEYSQIAASYDLNATDTSEVYDLCDKANDAYKKAESAIQSQNSKHGEIQQDRDDDDIPF